MRCEKCGESLSVREKFCGRCGADNKSYSADGMLKCSVCGKSYITLDEKCPYCTQNKTIAQSEAQDQVPNASKQGCALPVYERNPQYIAPPSTFKELLFTFMSQKMGVNTGHYNNRTYRPIGKFVVCPGCDAECAPEDNYCYLCGESLKSR